MAFEKLGIGGLLTFDGGNATAQIGKASRAMAGLSKSARGVRDGMGQVAAGLGKLTLAATPAALVLGAGVKAAANFESQMSAVAAVSGATAEQLASLTEMSKVLGIETQFSATQAAEGMENLARAGFSVEEIMTAIPGVLAAAGAEQMDLGAAAQITSNVLRGLALETSDAKRVADVLALASASAATTMMDLGSAFQFAAPTAARYNLELEETSAILGIFANSGVRGTMAGTSFNAVMRSMLTMTSKAKESMKKLGISFFDTTGTLLPMPQIIDNFNKGLGRLKTEQERQTVIQQIFQERGAKGFAILLKQGGGALTELTAKLKAAGDATDEMGNKVGAAAQMAAKRLDNFSGATTLLKSSIESYFISTVGGFLDGMASSVRGVTDSFNKVLFAMNDLAKDDSLESQIVLAEKFGDTAVQIALGVRGAMDDIRTGIAAVRDTISSVAAKFGDTFGDNTLSKIVRFGGLFVVAAAMLVPVIAGVALIGLAISGIVTVAAGLATIVGAVLAPAFLGAAAAAAVVVAIFTRGGSAVDEAWMNVRGTVDQLIESFQDFLPAIKLIGGFIVETMTPAFDFVATLVADTFGGAFKLIGGVLSAVMDGINAVVTLLSGDLTGAWDLASRAVQSFGDGIVSFVMAPLRMVATVVASIIEGLLEARDFVGIATGAETESGRSAVNALRSFSQLRAPTGETITPAEAAQRDTLARSKAAQDAKVASLRAAAAAGGQVPAPPGADQPAIDLKLALNTSSQLCVDGRQVANAQAKYKTEITERAGFKQTPWQRVAVATRGVDPATAAGG